MEFNEWLETIELSKYADVFAENDIDEVTILADLSDEELESLGIPVGARKKILRALGGERPPSAIPETGQTQSPGFSTEHSADPQAGVPTEAIPEHGHAANVVPAANNARSSRIEAKGKSSGKATAILVAVAAHLVILLVATTLTIFAASRDEPELVATIAPPSTTPQQEMKKKTVQKQVKRSPTSRSAAAAPMAQMMKASAEARFTTPDVTKTSTGPLGMGEGELGS